MLLNKRKKFLGRKRRGAIKEYNQKKINQGHPELVKPEAPRHGARDSRLK